MNGEKKSPVECVPKLGMCPKGDKLPGIEEGSFGFLSLSPCAPKPVSFRVSVSLGHQNNGCALCQAQHCWRTTFEFILVCNHWQCDTRTHTYRTYVHASSKHHISNLPIKGTLPMGSLELLSRERLADALALFYVCVRTEDSRPSLLSQVW